MYKFFFPKASFKYYKFPCMPSTPIPSRVVNNEKKKKMNVYYFSQQCLLLGIQACSTIDYSFFVRKQVYDSASSYSLVGQDHTVLVSLHCHSYFTSLHIKIASTWISLFKEYIVVLSFLYIVQIYTLYYGFVIEEDYQPVNERRSKESLSQSNISRCYIKSNSGRIHKFYHDYYDTLIANPVKKSHHRMSFLSSLPSRFLVSALLLKTTSNITSGYSPVFCIILWLSFIHFVNWIVLLQNNHPHQNPCLK